VNEDADARQSMRIRMRLKSGPMWMLTRFSQPKIQDIRALPLLRNWVPKSNKLAGI